MEVDNRKIFTHSAKEGKKNYEVCSIWCNDDYDDKERKKKTIQ